MDGSVAFVIKDKKLLLVKRRDVPIWVLPGGGIESGETPEQCSIRETREETGLNTIIVRKIAEYTYERKNKRIHSFKAQVINGKFKLNNEAKDIKYFSINKLPEMRHPFITSWLKDLNMQKAFVIKRDIKEISIIKVLSQAYKHPIIVIRYLLLKLGIHVNL